MLRQVPIRIVRRLSLEEAQSRLDNLEEKYGCGFEDFQERVNREGEMELFDDYLEWSYMFHALRAYGEEGEFDCVMEEERELTGELLFGLTPRRIELLYEIPKIPVRSINDLATRVERDVKNVYNDLRCLERLGLILLRRRGRSIVPELLVEELTFIFE